MTAATTASGRPNRTLSLIVATSRVTRVTRSPELALSTLPSGSRSTVATTYSRAAASRSCPKITDISRAKNVRAAWTTTTPATATAKLVSTAAAVPGSAAWSTMAPRIRGTTSPATAASACKINRAMTRSRRVRSMWTANATTAGRSATGSPRSGRRLPAKYSRARCSRRRWRARQARSRSRSRPSRGGMSSGGTAGGSGAVRQVSAEPGSQVCVSVMWCPREGTSEVVP